MSKLSLSGSVMANFLRGSLYRIGKLSIHTDLRENLR
jgi:hypothetical protein